MADIKEEQKTIAKGAFWSIFGTVTIKGISFIYTIILAHLMTQNQIGDFYLAVSVLGLLTIFTNIGIGKSFSRYLPYFYGKEQFKELKVLLKFGIFIAPVLPLIASILVFFGAELLSGFFDNPNLIPLLKIMSAYIFLDALFKLGNAVLTGRKRIDYVRTSTIIQDFSKLILTLILFYLIGVNTETLAYAFVLSFVFGAIYSLFRAYYEVKKINFGNIIESRKDYVNIAREIVPFGLIISVITSMWMLISYSDRLMLGYLLPEGIASVQVGIYSIALGLGKLTLVFPTALGVIFFPVISELFGRGDKEKMEKTTETTVKWVLLITVPISLLIILFSNNFLDLFYGSDYEAGATVLILFTVGFLIRSIGTIPGYVLATLRRLDIELKITLLTAIINVAINFLLIPIYGMNGAAFASFFSFLIFTILLVHYSKKLADFKFPLDSYKPLVAGILAFGLLLLFKPYLWPILTDTVSNIQIGAGKGGTFEEILQKVIKLAIFGILFIVTSFVYFVILLGLKAFGKDEIDILDAALRKGRIPEKYRGHIKKILEAEYIPKIM